MAKVLYHNDTKGKSQSHEIYSKDLEDHFDVFLQGYGGTKEEAFSEFVERLDKFSLKLEEFRRELHIDNLIFVDGSGYPIKQ